MIMISIAIGILSTHQLSRSHKPAFVVLVATHGDLAKNKTSNEELRRKVEAKFGNVFTLEVFLTILSSERYFHQK